MKRFTKFTFAALAMFGVVATAWSQAGQGGVAGTSGAAGASSTAGGRASAAGAGPAVPAATGTAAVPGNAAAAGRANVGQNRLSSAPPNFNNFNGITRTPFFSDPGVRQQLNLNLNQFQLLNRAYLDAFKQYNQGVTGLSPNLTPQQRQQQLQLLANRFNTDFSPTLDTTFTDRQLRTRYDQLYRQYLGVNAFNDAAIQRQLNLNAAQQAQLRRLAAQWRQQMMQLNGTSNQNVTAEQWAATSAQYWNQLNSILTPEQQQIWMQLTGQRYTFSPNVYFPTAGTGPQQFQLDAANQAAPQPPTATPNPGATTR